MSVWLKLARAIDRLNEGVGRLVPWLVLVMTLISAGNAMMRKFFDFSSNGLLEVQWYLFSAIFLLCAGYALQKNAHVRVDVLTGRLGPRVQAWIDIFGTLFFLLPIGLLVLWLSWDVFLDAFHSMERSSNAGGLLLWPARLLVPAGFALLLLQGISELIKRVAFLCGRAPDPLAPAGPGADEALAAEIRRTRKLEESSGGAAP